ncbi:hypothetical protein JXQ70_15025 [bacterium]|nr:hypothetical protein [bacterium]
MKTAQVKRHNFFHLFGKSRFFCGYHVVLAMMFVCLVSSTAWTRTIDLGDKNRAQGLEIVRADAQNVELRYTINNFQMDDLEINGEPMHQISIPGVMLPADEGVPNLPSIGHYIAIPRGAQVTVEIINKDTHQFKGVLVAPAPKIPKETDPPPLKYTKRSDIYTASKLFPEHVALFSEPMKIRGVDAIILSLRPFQWNPVTQDLQVHRTLQVRLHFEGGTGYFGEDRLRSRFFEPMLQQLLVNYSSLPEIDFDARSRSKDDEYEYLIIIPDDPVFLTWANVIKEWRVKQGITTGVFDLSVTGSTSAEIEAFIDNCYTTWSNPPVAVLLMSDYPSSGKTYGITSPAYSYYISDNVYADVDEDQLPDINFARLTAQDQDDLEIMVNKIIDYESNPVTEADFYAKPVAAGGWQSDRWFILCSEIVYGFWANGLGKTPTREYAGASGAPSYWSTNSNTSMLVSYFGPSGLGYIPATPAHLTDWGGNATRINTDINNGTFVILHRDHGGVDGWSDPSYTISDLPGLSNTNKLPFVFSINCLTGKFNISSECFVEAFHRMIGGALGLIGATEESYSFVNDTYVFGMMDSMWPDFDPGNNFTPLGEQELRPGFASVAGKYYLQASSWPSNPESKDTVYYLFHMHGDAFTTLYSEVPQNMAPIHDSVLLAGLDFMNISAPEGTLIGLTVDGALIGRAEGTGGVQAVSITPQYPPAEVLITITGHNYFRYTASIPVIPPDGPYVIYNASVINDSSGNNNGQADYGEAFTLDFSVTNVGNETADDVTVTIAPPDGSGVIVSDNTEFFGQVLSGTPKTIANAYALTFPVNLVDLSLITFDVSSVSPDKVQWDSHFSIRAHAPDLKYVSTIVDDSATGNDNQQLDPGETALVTVFIENKGSSDALNLTAHLSSTLPGVTIQQPTQNIGTVVSQTQVGIEYTMSAASSINSGEMADFVLTLTGPNGFTPPVLDFQIRIGNVFALIFEPDPSPISGDAIESALQSLNKSLNRVQALPADISQYDVIFVLLGIYSSNHVLTEAEGSVLANYLGNGGNIYMEGGDTWYYDQLYNPTTLHPYFHINATADGSGDIAMIEGIDGTLTQGLLYDYNGGNNYIDRLNQGDGAVLIFRNTNPVYGAAVCYDSGTYKTIGASFELGGLEGDTNYLINKYLEFFGLVAVPTLSGTSIALLLGLLSAVILVVMRRTNRTRFSQTEIK